MFQLITSPLPEKHIDTHTFFPFNLKLWNLYKEEPLSQFPSCRYWQSLLGSRGWHRIHLWSGRFAAVNVGDTGILKLAGVKKHYSNLQSEETICNLLGQGWRTFWPTYARRLKERWFWRVACGMGVKWGVNKETTNPQQYCRIFFRCHGLPWEIYWFPNCGIQCRQRPILEIHKK